MWVSNWASNHVIVLSAESFAHHYWWSVVEERVCKDSIRTLNKIAWEEVVA